MSVATPGSWLPKPVPKMKKPFVLQPHLNNRPLAESPELLALRKSLKKGKKK